jgi:ribosome-binding protein aMBF1 (putative translation factor)
MKKSRPARVLIDKWMKDKKFREAYDALGPEYALASALIEARTKAKLTQKALAHRMKTTQPMIARMERGRQPPSTATLLKIAKATGTRLQIRFVAA